VVSALILRAKEEENAMQVRYLIFRFIRYFLSIRKTEFTSRIIRSNCFKEIGTAECWS